jgi:acetolactate synthase small subunit
MRQTISILLDNRFGEVERVIGLFSGAGFKIEKMILSESDEKNLSKFVIVAETNNKNVSNIIIRLKQLIRVESVECVEGDHLQTAQASLKS